MLCVAPFVGAWIETSSTSSGSVVCTVAPFVGAWIETIVCLVTCHGIIMSLPSWERGLKHDVRKRIEELKPVAPFVGAWIETNIKNRR